MEKLYYSYEIFRKDYKKLSDELKNDFNPDVIVAIARGGYTLAHSISEYLEIRELYSISSKLYNDSTKNSKIDISTTPADLKKFKRIILVDDIIDSGETIKSIKEKLELELDSDTEIKILSIFKNINAVVTPDYYIKESKEWVVFFWEKDYK